MGHKQQGYKLREFFEFLAVCHTCVVDRDSVTKATNYQASSPDELALVMGAK